jgi:predicted nucleotidyltransferase
MIYSLDELAELIRPVAEKYKLPSVYIFGSYARGEATEESDVDILVELNGSLVKGIKYGGLFEDLSATVKKRIDMVNLESLYEPFNIRHGRFFADNVMNEKVSVYENR